jgi:hypothetical protein
VALFFDIISLIGAAASISGVSLKDLIVKRTLLSNDRQKIELFMRFLEGREVLFAGMDDEVQAAVVRSLEDIKREAEELRLRCNDEHVQTVLLSLLLAMSKHLQKLHGITGVSARENYQMYLTLQSTRFELARTLALLCAGLDIEPQNPRMKKFVLDFAVRPR